MNPLKWMDGWKTIVAGLGLIGLGVYQFSQGDVQTGITTILAGLAAIGIGRKLDRAAAR